MAQFRRVAVWQILWRFAFGGAQIWMASNPDAGNHHCWLSDIWSLRPWHPQIISIETGRREIACIIGHLNFLALCADVFCSSKQYLHISPITRFGLVARLIGARAQCAQRSKQVALGGKALAFSVFSRLVNNIPLVARLAGPRARQGGWPQARGPIYHLSAMVAQKMGFLDRDFEALHSGRVCGHPVQPFSTSVPSSLRILFQYFTSQLLCGVISVRTPCLIEHRSRWCRGEMTRT